MEPSIHTSTPMRLIDELRLVIGNAEELLRNTSGAEGDVHQQARARLAQALAFANGELERFEDAALSRMIAATRADSELHADTSGEARVMRAFK